MPKTIIEHIGNLSGFLNRENLENFSKSDTTKSLLIPIAKTRVKGFDVMIIGSRPCNGRTLFLNELLIANTVSRSTDSRLESTKPLRSLAYFLTEKLGNYFDKLISGFLNVKQENLRRNNHFHDTLEFDINELKYILTPCPLYLEFILPSGLQEFTAAIETDIKSCNPDFIFIDGLEYLAKPEHREYDSHSTRNIDPWLDACLELSQRYSIPFIITRLLNPQYDRSFDLFQPVFSDFNSSTIDSACDIVISMVRPTLNGIDDKPDWLKNDKALQFMIHRDRTGTLSGKYQCEIDLGIPKIVFPK